jgi:hypothetical protein
MASVAGDDRSAEDDGHGKDAEKDQRYVGTPQLSEVHKFGETYASGSAMLGIKLMFEPDRGPAGGHAVTIVARSKS